MNSELRLFFVATALSAAAGSVSTLAIARATGWQEPRDPGTLPAFEDRYMRIFELPEQDRKYVRAILYKYQERRREIEGRAAAAAAMELSDLGRTMDTELCAILPPDKQKRYYALLDVGSAAESAGPQNNKNNINKK